MEDRSRAAQSFVAQVSQMLMLRCDYSELGKPWPSCDGESAQMFRGLIAHSVPAAACNGEKVNRCFANIARKDPNTGCRGNGVSVDTSGWRRSAEVSVIPTAMPAVDWVGRRQA